MNAALPFERVAYGMPAEDYHREEALSASGAKKILRSPRHFRTWRDEPSRASDAMDFGSAVHCGVLEPDTIEERIVRAPDINKRTKDGKAEWVLFQSQNCGKIILSGEDYARAIACVESVRSHPAARRLLDGAEVEVSLFWRDGLYKTPSKARYDIWSHGGITDLKTTVDASPDGFGRQIASYLYHVQGAHYWSGAEHAMHVSPQFFAFIAVESEAPHAVGVYTLPKEALMAGARLMDEAHARYKRASEAGQWPGYGDTIQPIQLPRWALAGF